MPDLITCHLCNIIQAYMVILSMPYFTVEWLYLHKNTNTNTLSISKHKMTSYINVSCPMCADVDECGSDNGGCQHRCINENGEFHCECFPGYVLASDGTSCNGGQRC